MEIKSHLFQKNDCIFLEDIN